MKSCMPWIGIKRSGIDKKGSDVHAKRNFNPCDSISMFFGSICDKEVAEKHNESIDYFKEFFINVPGDNMERTLGMAMQHVDD